ncbi:16S rRNA (adenine(1518)-N(6)/adenine(1519)-N(6))-dimethyltransferase RsmA [Geminisphaera colitermitum]|uniref:16S rRNA (adenine(1518)-N(6)/adenine(1519)-N(6))- dimethyltransferase RsmA n=1 Tax=Geminisphaera colitermitum TaxID=1148786 RepID=UPI000158CF7D|nr:16S rRNA (adenine(1518)-N(6)/adenine(1519)-N(6))-dimethyltransferase RsmA [Geminisphaera colitermitum]
MPLSPSATRELLARLGHTPKRFLGQNFLVDGNIVRKSLELAAVSAGDTVVEVGPGLGTLTRALLIAGANVWAVEKDAALYAHLAATLAPEFPGTLHLMEGDAVEFPLAGLKPAAAAATGTGSGSDFKIVANLPYAISTPWMDAVLSGPLPLRMVLMLQLEAAQRYVAQPGSKLFGGISILLQSAFEVAPGHRVSGACFHPRPDVDSCLLHLVRRAQPYVFRAETKALIRACFQQRRKQIRPLLRGRLPDDGRAWLATLEATTGLGGNARPEEIPVPAWQALDRGE